ncbi:hypothetical protein AO411_2027895 [Salmonella enterica subsp. enterica serovar Sarajane]|nr:hypothetical protein AO411_2027895 [Salmonella enterica subsp. enterica serovar Sarajane]
MIAYFVLFVYSCVFCISLGLIFMGGGALFIYLTKGYFFFPVSQVMRVLVFASIAATSITLAAIVFKLIDKFNACKKPPSDSD